MNRARPQTPSCAPIYAPNELAAARWLVTNSQNFAHLDPDTRRASIDIAWTILRKNRAIQQPQKTKPTDPTTTARVLRVPLAVFQAGPIRLRRHPRHRITIGPTTPGEAA